MHEHDPAPGRRIAPDTCQESIGCAPHPSARELFTSLLKIFTARGFSEKCALAVTYFAIATWFSDCLPEAPCLLITGPSPEARLLLEMLECVVFHPQPLFELTGAGFLALDMNLEPTLLIVQEGISASLWHLIRASNYRNAQISGAKGIQKIYCAKAIYLGAESAVAGSDRSLLRVDLSPLRRGLPVLEADQKAKLIAKFQPKMQAYRQRNWIQARDARFDLPELSSAIRILALVLGAPIVSAPELQAALGPLLREYQEALCEGLWCDPKCVVIEAALFYSHDTQLERVHVKKIADMANLILKGRGESWQLEAKAVGAILRQFGLSPKRDAKGFSVRLEDGARRLIHQVASRLQVAAAQQGAMSCVHCVEFFRHEPVADEQLASTE
jgi:hypothetical protein